MTNAEVLKVFEEIKAEITQKSNKYLLTHDIEVQSQGYGLSEALEIIDKHIGVIKWLM